MLNVAPIQEIFFFFREEKEKRRNLSICNRFTRIATFIMYAILLYAANIGEQSILLPFLKNIFCKHQIWMHIEGSNYILYRLMFR